MKLSLVLLLSASLGCTQLQAVVSAATPGVINCFRDHAVEREAAKALRSDSPENALDALEQRSGLQKVTCALWEIIRSLGAAVQAGETTAGQPEEGIARKESDQPAFDAAKRWLRSRKQTTVPPEQISCQRK